MNVIIIHSLVNCLMCADHFILVKVLTCALKNVIMVILKILMLHLILFHNDSWLFPYLLCIQAFFFYWSRQIYFYIYRLCSVIKPSKFFMDIVIGILENPPDRRNFIDDRAGNEQYRMFWSYTKWNLTCGLRININRPSKLLNWLCLLEQFLIGTRQPLQRIESTCCTHRKIIIWAEVMHTHLSTDLWLALSDFSRFVNHTVWVVLMVFSQSLVKHLFCKTLIR